MIAIFKKELRDCLRWTPLGMSLGLIMLYMSLPNEIYSATAMDGTLAAQLGLAAALTAIALGLLQSLLDTRNDSRGYLLHRPISASNIFWGKVAAGYVAYMVSLAVPVIVAMIYLQAKGIERLPTNALQVVPFLFFSFAVFLLHPTVIWIANRDAHWVGTRLLPAIGTIFVTYMFFGLGFAFESFAASASLTLAIFACLAFVTLFGAKHAFVHQSQLPPRSASHWRSITCMVGLVFSGIVLYGSACGFLLNSIPTTPGDNITYKITMNSQGEWQQVAKKAPAHDRSDEYFLTRGIDGKGEFTKVDDSWQEEHGSRLHAASYGHGSPLKQFKYLGFSRSETAKGGSVTLVGHRGKLLVYDGTKTMVSIVTPSGRLKHLDEASVDFLKLDAFYVLNSSSQISLGATANPLLVDDHGLYQFISDQLRVEKLSDGKFDRVMLLLEEIDRPASLWTLSDDTLTMHHVAAKDPADEMPQANSPKIEATRNFKLPPLDLKSSESWKITPPTDEETLRVVRTPEGGHALIRENSATRVSDYAVLGDGGIETLGSVKLPMPQTGRSEAWVGWSLPPVLLAVVGAIVSLMVGVGIDWPFAIVFAAIGHAVLAALATWWLAGRYGIAGRARTTWTILGSLLGFGTLIGMLAIYRRHVLAECPRCREDRRIDLDKCEHCGKLWDPPQPEGIEIFQNELSFDALEAASPS
ncbi:hypothetical protein N9L06_05620 [Mariniblastus sp.]|nr:hypothetical protein [Mariniblastus sp.]